MKFSCSLVNGGGICGSDGCGDGCDGSDGYGDGDGCDGSDGRSLQMRDLQQVDLMQKALLLPQPPDY